MNINNLLSLRYAPTVGINETLKNIGLVLNLEPEQLVILSFKVDYRIT